MSDARLLRLLGVAAEAIEEASMLLSPSDGDGAGMAMMISSSSMSWRIGPRWTSLLRAASGYSQRSLACIGRSERSGWYWIPSTDRPTAAEASIRTGRASVRSTAMVPEPGWSSGQTLPRVVDTRPYGE